MKDRASTSSEELPSLYPDKDWAQVVLEADHQRWTLQAALDLANSLNIRLIDVRRLAVKGQKETYLIKISDEEMRPLVLRLVEAGFSNVKGYHSASLT